MRQRKLVFNRKIAAELRKRGFKLIETMPNHNNPKLDVYVFEDSPEINAAWGEVVKYIKQY
jgi:hypothetical protein